MVLSSLFSKHLLDCTTCFLRDLHKISLFLTLGKETLTEWETVFLQMGVGSHQCIHKSRSCSNDMCQVFDRLKVRRLKTCFINSKRHRRVRETTKVINNQKIEWSVLWQRYSLCAMEVPYKYRLRGWSAQPGKTNSELKQCLHRYAGETNHVMSETVPSTWAVPP